MKRVYIILTLLCFFSSPARAAWELVTYDEAGNEYFVDFTRTKTDQGFHYFWGLLQNGPRQLTFSDGYYIQGGCEERRYIYLEVHAFEGPMGTGDVRIHPQASRTWRVAPQGSPIGLMLEAVCSR